MSLVASKCISAAVLLGSLFAAGCSGQGSAEEAPSSAAPVSADPGPGSLVARHGLVLFGKEALHLSHIPTFDQPHNIQVVVDAKVVSGIPVASQVFTDRLYTVKPLPFSLYDLAHGTLSRIKGVVYSGSFELADGRPMYNVELEVTRVIFQSGLDPATATRPTLDYLALGTPADPYLVHVIDSPTSFDSVTRITLPENSVLDAAALDRGTFVTVKDGVNAVGSRLAAGAEVEAVVDPGARDRRTLPSCGEDAGAPTASSSVTVGGELYCSLGNDFYDFCPPAH